MKRLFTSGVFLLFFFSLFGQVTLDTVYFNSKWKKTRKVNASYYRIIVKLPDGRYNFSDYWISGEIQSTGTFSDLKHETNDGEFKWYNKNGSIKEIENISNNKIIGITKLFDANGNPDIEYLQDLESLDNKKEIKKAIDDFIVFVKTNLNYPEKSRLTDKQGKVIIPFFIDENGLPYRIKVSQSVSNELDTEAIRIVKLYKWPSPIYQGKPTKLWVALPITFNLI